MSFKPQCMIIGVIIIGIFSTAYSNEDWAQEAASFAGKACTEEVTPHFDEAFDKQDEKDTVEILTKRKAQRTQEEQNVINNLNSINPNLLEAEGRFVSRQRSINEKSNMSEADKLQSEVNDYYLDASDSRLNGHTEEIDDIVEASNKSLIDLTKSLNEQNFNCTEYGGTNKTPGMPYRTVLKPYIITDTVYDKVLCEQLKNKYNCYEEVNLRCSNKVNQSVRIENLKSNINTHLDDDGSSLSSISNQVKGRFDAHISGPNLIVNYHGDFMNFLYIFNIFEASIDFTVPEKKSNAKFILENLNYEDIVIITVNGTQVYGSLGATKIVMGDSREVYNPPLNDWWRFPIMKLNDSGLEIPSYTFGSLAPHLPPVKRWNIQNLNKDITHLISQGANNIKIKGYMYAKGGFELKFSNYSPECTQWQEDRNEVCTHAK